MGSDPSTGVWEEEEDARVTATFTATQLGPDSRREREKGTALCR